MVKIEQLTPTQKDRLIEFREKWVAIGVCTDPADRPRAEAAIRQSYKLAGLKPPRKIVWCGSPFSQGLTLAIILDRKLQESVEMSVGAFIGASVRESVEASVRESVWASVRESVWASVKVSMGVAMGTSVKASVWEFVGESAEASLFGQHDAWWLAFYDYFGTVCGLRTQTKKLAGLWELSKSAGWALPYAKICWVSERHHILKRNERGQLHAIAGPAVEYPDGWKIYALNGIRVPATLVETLAEELNPLLFITEPNAEIRREILRKVGIDRFCTKLGTRIIDKKGDYELHLVDLRGTTGLWPYLKMRNPSIDAWHMEAVDKQCMTVEEALNWRNGGGFKHIAPLS